jgi:MATE family multidrug resistance protein
VFFYYVVGIPLGFYLGFKCELHTAGLYAGLLVAIILIFSIMLALILRFDWEEESAKARERVGAEC